MLLLPSEPSLPGEDLISAARPNHGRQPIDIADLLAWAVLKADECSRSVPISVAAVARSEDLGEDEGEAADDDPAARDRRRLTALRSAAVVEARRGGPAPAPLDGDAAAVLAALRRLGALKGAPGCGRAAMHLLAGSARLGQPFDWRAGPYEFWRKRDRRPCDRKGNPLGGRWWLGDGPAARAAFAGRVCAVPVVILRQGEEVTKKRLDAHGNIKGVETVLIDRSRELQQARASYALWHQALEVLRGALSAPPTPLSRYAPTGPAAPAAPWTLPETAELLTAAE